MKSFKGFAMGLVLGIGLAVSGLAFAQNTTDQKKEGESCCAMSSCCCKDGCSMKDHKEHAASHSGCCCCGDSCDMKMHDTTEKPKG